MKKIIFTQRVENVAAYQERRDCGDQNIVRFLSACGYLPIPIPNVPEVLEGFLHTVKPEGIVLTGGNSLVKYGGDAPERDDTDRFLIQCAVERKIPLFGFCRGMQSVLDFYGTPLMNVSGHVAVRHKIFGQLGQREVNSYHNQAAIEIPDPLEELARTEDGVIEAVRHNQLPILAIMWHPEREKSFDERDMEQVRMLFQ